MPPFARGRGGGGGRLLGKSVGRTVGKTAPTRDYGTPEAFEMFHSQQYIYNKDDENQRNPVLQDTYFERNNTKNENPTFDPPGAVKWKYKAKVRELMHKRASSTGNPIADWGIALDMMELQDFFNSMHSDCLFKNLENQRNNTKEKPIPCDEILNFVKNIFEDNPLAILPPDLSSKIDGLIDKVYKRIIQTPDASGGRNTDDPYESFKKERRTKNALDRTIKRIEDTGSARRPTALDRQIARARRGKTKRARGR